MIAFNSIKIPSKTYRSQAEDTNIQNDLVEFYLLRKKTETERLSMSCALMCDAKRLSLQCLKRRFSHLTSSQFAQKIALTWLQEDYPLNFTPVGNEMTWIQDSTTLAGQLHKILESLNLRYYITGGLAAIAYGEPRTTRDVDLVVEIDITQIEFLVQILEQEGFYVPGVEDVLNGRFSYLSITHIESISRADLIISGQSDFDKLKCDRRCSIQLPQGDLVYFASPEDVILSKLLWRKNTDSEKQWRDLLGILKVQGDNLDYLYLQENATKLNVIDALNQAYSQAF